MRKFFLCVFISVAVFIAAFEGNAKEGRPGYYIKIDANRVSSSISPLIFGSNIQWEYDGGGLIKEVDIAQNKLVFNEAVIEKIKKLNITLLRFPGGSLSDKYNWKYGIGKLSLRKNNINLYGKSLPSNFGLDEFIKLCDLINCEPLITVNFNITPREAKELVEYCNGPERSRKVKYWEIGNEIYSTLEEGHTTAEAYAEKYIEFYEEMKEADPDINIGAGFEVTFQKAGWVKKLYPHLLTWNEKLVKALGSYLDFVSVHFYSPNDVTNDLYKLNKVAMASPKIFVETLNGLSRLLGGKTKVMVTEYNIFFDANNFRKVSSLEGGLFVGCMLMEFAKNNIYAGCHWSLLNNGYFGMIKSRPSVTERPSFKVFKLIRERCGDFLVDAKSQAPFFKCDALGTFPGMANIPTLEYMASLNDTKDVLYLIVINKSPQEIIKSKISLAGFGFERKVSINEIYPKGLFLDNEEKDNIITSDFEKEMEGDFLYSFKPCSITAFIFKKSNSAKSGKNY